MNAHIQLAKLADEFMELAGEHPEMAEFLVALGRRYPDGGITLYLPSAKRSLQVRAASLRAEFQTLQSQQPCTSGSQDG